MRWPTIPPLEGSALTRAEQTGNRDLAFSHWLRSNLRDSAAGLTITDIDFVLFDYKRKRLMLLEVKTSRAEVPYAQQQIYQLLHRALLIAAPVMKLNYHGYHVLVMSNTAPDNSETIYVDGKRFSTMQLTRFLNMEANDG